MPRYVPPPRLGRLALLLTLAMAAAAVLLAGGVSGQEVSCPPTVDVSSPPLDKWVQELARPGVHQPVSRSCGVSKYTVTMSEFQQQLHPLLPPTTVYGYQGSYPGPSFEAVVGEPVQVTWVNQLPAQHLLPTERLSDVSGSAAVVHLHGGHTPAESDGNPKDWISRGESVVYYYPNQQLATTLWYHDHALGITRTNVYSGLAGFYLLWDKDEAKLGLPSGAYEIPLAIQDRTVLPDGQLYYPCQWQPEFFGDLAVVNGRVWPFVDMEATAYRFRLLNGCNSRFLNLTLSPSGPKIWQIGTDGGFLNEAVPLDTLLMGPGERADVIIDFFGFSGQNLVLTNNAATPFPGGGVDKPLPEILQFRVSSTKGAHKPYQIPSFKHVAELPKNRNELGYRYTVARERQLTLVEIDIFQNGVNRTIPTLTGRRFEDPPTELPLVDTVEVWNLINLTPDTHPIHLHLVQFRLQERRPFNVSIYQAQGEVVFTGPPLPIGENELGWKDVIQTPPGVVTTILVPFEDFTGDYVWHCHILEHEDNDMMRPLIVRPREPRKGFRGGTQW